MEKWVPISLAVFLGVIVTIVVVFITLYSWETQPDQLRGPRLAVFLVPPPPPRRHYNWTDESDGGEVGVGMGLPQAANASLSALSLPLSPVPDLANSASVFPVDSSLPELFPLRPEDRLLSRQDAAGLPYRVMNVPEGPQEAGRGDLPAAARARAHKILRGDRRMFSGEVTESSPPRSPTRTSVSVKRTTNAIPPTTASAYSEASSTTVLHLTSSAIPSAGSATPALPTGIPHAKRLKTPDHEGGGGIQIFIRDEDTRAILEQTLGQGHRVEKAIIEKAMKALIGAYERHVEMEREASIEPSDRDRRTTQPPSSPLPTANQSRSTHATTKQTSTSQSTSRQTIFRKTTTNQPPSTKPPWTWTPRSWNQPPSTKPPWTWTPRSWNQSPSTKPPWTWTPRSWNQSPSTKPPWTWTPRSWNRPPTTSSSLSHKLAFESIIDSRGDSLGLRSKDDPLQPLIFGRDRDTRKRQMDAVRRGPIDYPIDYDNDYNQVDRSGPRRIQWPLRPIL